MQTDNRLLDDLARVATGALGTLQGAKGEIEGALRRQFERILADMDLVTREEFEVVQAMAAAARAENLALAERIAALEAAPAKPAAAKGGRRAAARKAPSKPRAASSRSRAKPKD